MELLKKINDKRRKQIVVGVQTMALLPHNQLDRPSSLYVVGLEKMS